MSIEVQHSDARAIKNLMVENGYKVIKHVSNVDIVFALNKL